MNLLQFGNVFASEDACKAHLKDVRLKEGIVCKNCEEKTRHYWLKGVEKFQCSVCRSRTNLRAGTMFEKTKMPLRTWFMIIHLMTSTKKPLSALELQRQVGHKRYEPVWYIMLKIRHIMGKRDENYQLEGEIELDDGFFEVVTLNDKKQTIHINTEPKKRKRGRGSEKQGKVLVMVESAATKQEKPHNKNRIMGFMKMIAVDSLGSKSINYEVQKAVKSDTFIHTDKWIGYNRLTQIMDIVPDMQKVSPEEAMEKLPWVHTMIANAKRQLLGVHHSINRKYLQLYLNEFTYKVNRRYFSKRDPFDGLLTASVVTTWY